MELDISYPPEEWSLHIEYTESGEREVIPGESLPDLSFALSSQSATYTVFGSFFSEGVWFDMALYLDVVVE